MKSIIKDMLIFLWRRDSESACLMCICLTNYLDEKDAKGLGDYFNEYAKYIGRQYINE